MAASEGWIEALLHNALDEYCSVITPATSGHYRSSNFSYSNETSYLRIKPVNKRLRSLTIVQLFNSQGQPLAQTSDGVHALPFNYGKSRLLSITHATNNAPIEIGSVLTTNDIEFRVSFLLAPFQAELYLKTYRLVGTPISSANTKLPLPMPLDEVPRIQQLLTTIKNQPDTRSHESRSHSQNSLGGGDAASGDQDSENEGSFSSQAAFQTQIPHTPALRESGSTLSTNLDMAHVKPAPISTAQRHQQERKLNLLRPDPAETRLEHNNRILPVQPKALLSKPVTPKSSTLEPTEVKPNSHVASSVLSQQPLEDTRTSPALSSMPPPSAIPLHERSQPSTASKDSAHQDASELAKEVESSSTRIQTMPASMQDRFRRWRAEGLADRYLPRRITKIPKTQSVLLDSEDSYYPPLAGRDIRPGNVPLPLLNSATAQADKPAIIQRASAPGESHSMQDERNLDTAPVGEVIETTVPSLDSSQQVPWSSSPAPPVRGSTSLPDSSEEASSEPMSEISESPVRKAALPPSSPPVQSPVEQVGEESDTTSVRDNMSVVSKIPPATAPQASPEHAAQPSSLPTWPKTEFQLPEKEPPMSAREQQQSCARSRFPELFYTARHNNRDAQSTVQVKRTPYPGKTVQSAPPMTTASASPEDLTGSGNDRVLSTYDEIAMLQYQTTKGMETGFVQRPPSLQPPPRQDQASISAKRRMSAESTDTNRGKRPRLVSEGRHLDNVDDDYSHVIEANRARRSAELSVLAKEKGIQERPKPAPVRIPSFQGLQTSSSITSAEPLIHPRSDPPAAQSTPITVPSSHSFRPHESDKVGRRTSGTSSMTPISDDVFQLYQSTYKDYKGDFKSFDNACILIRRLRKSRRSPHPSLFDDFIFHHYHSYSPYLQRIAQSSDDPLPYAEFYDDFIASPNHQSSVVTIRVLNRPTSRLDDLDDLRRESSNVAPQANTRSRDSDRSIGIESSASNQPPAQHQLFQQPPTIEPLRDEPEKMQLDSDHMDPSQRSSVKSWIEGIRGASPELGTPDIDRSQEIILIEDDDEPVPIHNAPLPASSPSLPAPVLPTAAVYSSTPLPKPPSTAAPTTLRKKQRNQPSASPFLSSSKRPTPITKTKAKPSRMKLPDDKWWKHENTPFKQFVERYSDLHSVKVENAAAAATSIVGPQQIDIYSWR